MANYIFEIENVNFTIDNSPVTIGKVKLSSEMSAQEIATSGGIINGLLKEIKPLIEEVTKPAPVVQTPQIQQNNHNNYNYNKNNKNNNRKNEKVTFVKPDAPESVEMRVNKLMLSKPKTIENVIFHKWEFRDDDKNIRATFELSTTDTFNISIKGNGTMVWVHVFASNTKISGLDFGSLPKFIDQAGFPTDVKAFIMEAIRI